jgi:HK97 family phage portal protein
MRIGPLAISWRTAATDLQQKQALPPLSGRGGWWPYHVREPYAGAWQRNEAITFDSALSFSAVFACTTLIMSDIGKLTLRLVEQDSNGIWVEVENPAYSPVLRRPNRYQNRKQFIESWVSSLLNSGNAYVLKQRDQRGVVVAMYVLDPALCVPLVAEDGSVYYELKKDHLAGLTREKVTVPASEILHDRINALFHPLVGLSPIYACARATTQGLSIQDNSNKLFSNGSIPGGVLTAPGAIGTETAARLKDYWQTEFSGDNVGKVAVLGDGLKYEGMAWNAVDLQLIEQLKWTAETVCSCYRVPPYLVDIGPPPPYANVEPLIQKYYGQCLQTIILGVEMTMDDGMALGRPFGNRYGTEFDPDDLIWMDAAAKSKAALDGIGSGGMSPNEARKRYYALGPVPGGSSPYLQQQYYSLEALAKRDADDPFAKPAPAALPPVPDVEDEDDEDDEVEERAASFSAIVNRKSIEVGLYA